MRMRLAFGGGSNGDGRLEEAGRLISGWPAVLRRITLPLSAPGILFSLVLIFLLAIGELSVPSFLRYPVLPVLSFTQFAASYNFGAATAAAVPLAALSFLGVFIESSLLRNRVFTLRRLRRGLLISLGRWKYFFAAIVGLVSIALVILPLSALFADAFSMTAMREA